MPTHRISTTEAEPEPTLDLKIVATAFGMDPDGVMIYLADHVDSGRLIGHRERRP